ncbi:CRISPR-associated protein [Kosmotoga arenicorallina S304]|uniref:CRISPR-associated protein n=1 Tax=Kosmotoga arenicorallina S304 TaxID=1453497 RepID=A0A182C864_9BACT|nr:type I-B CRISPR-associated protein Cas7/Cst2/DevR [Kosmotoga arenicorallina]OAA32509.1 CRISPR-associated protein [Kosmotoga arenicorallina S304]
MDVKALCWAHLAKVSIGNANASFTEGNIQTSKKITAPNGLEFNYISSQCQRHGMKERIAEKGFKLSTPIDADVETTLGDPVTYIDDDLFGYLKTDTNKRRTSPLRITPLVSLFPYKGDRDLLTKTRRAADRGGNLVETEIYRNIFRGGGLLELDRVGRFDSSEVAENSSLDTTSETKIERVLTVLDVLKNFWAGGKQTNFLTDLSPKFIVFALLKEKVPFLLEYIKVDEKGTILAEPIVEAINNYDDIIDQVVIGTTSVLDCSEIESISSPKVSVVSLNEAFGMVKDRIKNIYSE